jgi:DNA-directed RNA polymerase specialized sigma24 family protein
MVRPLLYFAQKLVNDESKALDVLQEVWLKAFQMIGRLEKPRLVRAWL